jgi:hypothetical protein
MEEYNPFPINGYVDSKLFCDRILETIRVSENLKNNRSCTMFSIRKMGKTALISHVFKQNTERKSVYLDILETQNVSDLAEILIKGILPAIESKPQKLLRWARDIFSRVSPVMEFDPITGQPGLGIKFAGEDAGKRSLEELFVWLSKCDGELWLAIDEFQQIVQYPTKGTEAQLRSFLQFCPALKMIFLGSQQDMLVSMFSDYGRPFYQSSDMMHLAAIPKKEYLPFIAGHMEAGKRNVDLQIIDDWYDRLKGHTLYVQQMMNHLYAAKPKKWNKYDYEIFFAGIVRQQEHYFITYRNLLSDIQWKVLQAVAAEGYVEKVQGKEWLMKHKLGTSSTIGAAVKVLTEREMLAKEAMGYRLMNPFLEYWFNSLYR